MPLSHVGKWCCPPEAWDALILEITQIPPAAGDDNPFRRFMGACLVPGGDPDYTDRIEDWARNGSRQ